MEVELEPRVKPLPFKVKGMSRELPSQKASHVLHTDLRSHWSTGTNTKEWILLELDDPCLLSHIQMFNKSVLEWEISVGLRYKPETFSKVRPRCEAPRRDMIYPMNYTPCRYVRVSCLRGNPIAIFFIQLIGVSVAGLEPEFQPVVKYLLPQIISHKQDAHNMYLQLLQDMTNRLVMFLPQLEADLNSFQDAMGPTMRFLTMLAGPFYPVLHIVNEKGITRLTGNSSDSEAFKNGQSSMALTVSSNFEPRRSRNPTHFFLPSSSPIVFHPDAIFTLLRKAYKDSHLGTVCRMASRILLKLIEPITVQEESSSTDVASSLFDEALKSESSYSVHLMDYSNLFGEEFQIPDDHWDSNYLNLLDVGVVEEAMLHVLYACASQPRLCSKLADSTSDFWSALPLTQALLPALRPNLSSPQQIDDNFSQWKQPLVQQALSQIVATSSSEVYRPLLRSCSGYLSSFSPTHAKAASVLIDLCFGVLGPWLTQVIAKVDLSVELLEDLLGVIQGARRSIARARAALKYIVLGLSGHMDDIMAQYKNVKHQILFLVEMLEPFLDPAIVPSKSTIAFGNLSPVFLEKQEHSCSTALNVIRIAVGKSAVLQSLETEWRRGSVAPSVLLSILEPDMQLPPDIDLCKFHASDPLEPESTVSALSSLLRSKSIQDNADGKTDISDKTIKMDILEDATSLFAPPELGSLTLAHISQSPDRKSSDSSHCNVSSDVNHVNDKTLSNQIHSDVVLDPGFSIEFLNVHTDYLLLTNYRDCELRASEFRRLALDLQLQKEITPEGHDATIDALLLAAECYINPFFVMSFKDAPKLVSKTDFRRLKDNDWFSNLRSITENNDNNLETVAHLERRRDKVVLEILLEAGELDRKYRGMVSDGEVSASYSEDSEEIISLSQHDIPYADAITLVRQNQILLCNFLIRRLQKENHSMHEILLQSLLFLLNSATKLSCGPETVIDIILESCESFSRLLTSYCNQFKEENMHFVPDKVHVVRRRWMLLQRLVIASSGRDEGSDFALKINKGFRFGNLIPPSAWIQKVPTFCSSGYPLVRFLCWMAVARNAEHYQKECLFLASDLSELTYLLSIFSDELALVDNVAKLERDKGRIEEANVKQDTCIEKGLEPPGPQCIDQSFCAIYPELCQLFPHMKKQFEGFGDTILNAVGLQLRSLSSTFLPDILCWFSDFCSGPFFRREMGKFSQNGSNNCKGFAAKNAKAIILYILEAIVVEHMEAMVPEIPRVVQVLVSLCTTSYCDVPFLDSILQLLKPIISFSFCKVSDEEKQLIDDSCVNFESLCFDELFSNIRRNEEEQSSGAGKAYNRALTIFILASVFIDLSFHRKREFLQSLRFWADFATFEPTNSFFDYICAFQAVMTSYKVLLVETLRCWGVIPLEIPLFSDISTAAYCGDSSESNTWFLRDVCQSSAPTDEELGMNNGDTVVLNQKGCRLSVKDVGNITQDFECLVATLIPTVEVCWKFHHQLAKKLTRISAECFVYSRCLTSIAEASASGVNEYVRILPSDSLDQFPVHWSTSLEGLADMILVLQGNHCWEMASVMLDFLLEVPRCFCLGNVISAICSAVKSCLCSAPKFAWRLQADKWLLALFDRGIQSFHESEIPVVDLFCAMLSHPEPEQRFIALKHLGKLVSQDTNDGNGILSSTVQNRFSSSDLVISASEAVLSLFVTRTWDHVAVIASTDTSLVLRSSAMALLVDYVPFAQHQQLQSLLVAADSILHGLTKLTKPPSEGPLMLISLALIATACMYSPVEDISLIPETVWRNIETLGILKTEGRCGDVEKKACQALCRLKNEGDKCKEILKDVLSSSSSRYVNPEFETTRESVLEVLGNLSSAQSYFNLFSSEMDQKAIELEEAEMEMDLIQKELALLESSNDLKDWRQLPFLACYGNDNNRLLQIKDGIQSLEKAKLREEIVARRQKKLNLRRDRQKYLEEAALHEAELLQELDRERATELERDIERQRLLEVERAKTRELRHNLDMEKEKQTQRELQCELEQVESGFPSSRREFSSSSHTSRPRERYRERENGRSVTEGGIRASVQGMSVNTNSIAAPTPTAVLSGSRQFQGQPPTILQLRDRDECGSSYEENFDGSKDSGDTGSAGDPDLISALEGQYQRHGSRGSKSRQIVERRERDGRRDGKWERKH